MDKSFKVVLIAFAIYFVLAVQFFFEKRHFIIPDVFNPITLFLVSLIVLIQSYKQSNFNINLIYFVGITIYAFTSERTLNILYNNTDYKLFLDIIQNPFLRLITILSLGSSLIVLTIKSIKISKNQFISLFFLILSIVFGLMTQNFQLFYMISFTIYVLLYYFLNQNKPKLTRFMAVNYQLILFIILENLFIILHNYC